MHQTNKNACASNFMQGMSTKPSTVGDVEKEPIPSFLKVLNIYQTEFSFEPEQDDYLYHPGDLSHSSGGGCITEGSNLGK